MEKESKSDRLACKDVFDTLYSKLNDSDLIYRLKIIELQLNSELRCKLLENLIDNNRDYSINTREEDRSAVLFDIRKRVQLLEEDYTNIYDGKENDAIRQILYCDIFLRVLADLNKLLKVDTKKLWEFLFNEEPQKQKIYK